MSTSLTTLINYVDSTQTYEDYPSSYIELNLANDELIFTAGSDEIGDNMVAPPTTEQLNVAATEISSTAATTIPYLLLYDYDAGVGGYYTHLVKGMSENKRYVLCFSFDGDTATEPRLEAWDTSAHTTTNLHVLGNGTPANSWVKAVCTTNALPGTNWAGTAIAGSGVGRYILLNAGNGALTEPASGETNDLYVNIKCQIPQNYATPAAESAVICVRYSYN